MSVTSITAVSSAVTNFNNLAANKLAMEKMHQAEIFRREDAEARTESLIEKKLVTDDRLESEMNSRRFEEKRLQEMRSADDHQSQASDLKTPANGLTWAENRPGSMRYDHFRTLEVAESSRSEENTTVGSRLDETV